MRAVNLLPPDGSARKSLRSEDPAVVVGSALGVIVLIALAAGFVSVHSKVDTEQKKLVAVRAELAKLSLIRQAAPVQKGAIAKPILAIPAVASEEQPRLSAIASAMSSRIAWDRILRELSLVLPRDVTLTALTLTAPAAPTIAGTPGGATGSQGLSMTGTAFSHDGVARLLARLMLIPDLTNVTLANSTASTAAPGVQFSLSAQVKGAVAPPVPPASSTTPASTDTTITGPTS